MLAPRTQLELSIEKPAAGGRMIGRHEGQIVFVRGAIPGERVLAEVEEISRGTAFAMVSEVLEPSPDRRPVAGDPRCGGNVYAHIAYSRQLALKAAVIEDAFTRIGRLTVPGPVAVTASPEHGYRLRARLHVKDDRIGFYREGSHVICDPGPSGQLLPETVAAIAALHGHVRGIASVEIAENIAADQRALHLELDAPPRSDDALRAFRDLPHATGVSVSVRGQSAVRVLSGSATVFDPLSAVLPPDAVAPPGSTLRRHVRGFFQGNRYLLGDLVRAMSSFIGDGPLVDLYSGVGLFAVAAAAQGRECVIAVEGDRTNAIDLRKNVEPFGTRITVAEKSVERFLSTQAIPLHATVVIDPPRTGVSAEALSGLIAARPSRVVYVSCDVATLARDSKALAGAGYQLVHLEAFDLFPNTGHIESVAAFSLS